MYAINTSYLCVSRRVVKLMCRRVVKYLRFNLTALETHRRPARCAIARVRSTLLCRFPRTGLPRGKSLARENRAAPRRDSPRSSWKTIGGYPSRFSSPVRAENSRVFRELTVDSCTRDNIHCRSRYLDRSSARARARWVLFLGRLLAARRTDVENRVR